MRKSDLRVGATYRGKTGGLRTITAIRTLGAINWRVHWSRPDGRLSSSTWAELFAKWAIEEVPGQEVCHG